MCVCVDYFIIIRYHSYNFEKKKTESSEGSYGRCNREVFGSIEYMKNWLVAKVKELDN